MRVFLDACVDPRVASILAGHEVSIAFEKGWHQLRDHALLPRVAAQFDVLVTIDRGFEHEHNLTKHRIGIVIVHVAKNKVEFYRALAGQLLTAINAVLPSHVIHVPTQRDSWRPRGATTDRLYRWPPPVWL